MSINFRFKSHLDHRYVFCWQRTPGSRRARKETVDIGILVTTRNGEPVEPVRMNICQSNTYRKDLSWPHFGNEPKVPANPSFLKDNFSSTTDPSIFT